MDTPVDPLELTCSECGKVLGRLRRGATSEESSAFCRSLEAQGYTPVHHAGWFCSRTCGEAFFGRLAAMRSGKGSPVTAPPPRRPWWKKKRWAVAAATVLLLTVAYPLSYGPAFYCFLRGWLGDDPQAAFAVYGPYHAACREWPALGEALVPWQDWWGRLAERHTASD